MNHLVNEATHLNLIASHFSSFNGFNSILTQYRYLSMKPYFQGSNCLELGSADGIISLQLIREFAHTTTVDGSTELVARLQHNYQHLLNNEPENDFGELVNLVSLFEDVKLDKQFDTIIMAHILEHVSDPVSLLTMAKSWLKPNGCLIITVPNANSIHRKVGKIMGLLKEVTDLNDADISVGHRRVYTWDTLSNDLNNSGFEIEKREGIYFKPLSNDQIDQNWDNKMIDAFYIIGKEFPEYCAEIMAICSPLQPIERKIIHD
jgi:2-polyprenyl-3-methyl-5-hydroxy-6-metoxy-1,4-benzoquinol methylase